MYESCVTCLNLKANNKPNLFSLLFCSTVHFSELDTNMDDTDSKKPIFDQLKFLMRPGPNRAEIRKLIEVSTNR